MSGPTISGSSAPSPAPLPIGSDISGAAVRPGDRIFRGISVGVGTVVLVVMVAIAGFLIQRTVPALRDDTASFFTTQVWLPQPEEGAKPVFGIAALLFHTLVTSVLAMLLAVPVALGIALFITFYAPRRLSQGLGYFVDL